MANFVYKPISEGDGNLVILIPADTPNPPSSLTIQTASGPVTLRGTGRTNGNRPTYRATVPGGQLQGPIRIGNVTIENPGQRKEFSPSDFSLSGDSSNAPGSSGINFGEQPATFGPSDADLDRLRSIITQGTDEFSPEDIFGARPRHEPFNPIDANQSAESAITGNLGRLEQTRELASRGTQANVQNALDRISALVPGFNELQSQAVNVIGADLRGELPFDDVLRVASNRAQLTSKLGIPGTGKASTLRDFGLLRMDAQQRGLTSLSRILADAQRISPNDQQINVQDFFVTPAQQIALDLEQAQLDQQSRQSGAFLEAGINPVATNLFDFESRRALGNFDPIPNPLAFESVFQDV